MGAKILCVAEKPSIAKAVSGHLSSRVRTRNVSGLPWLKNYDFDYFFRSTWGNCTVVFTSAAGHIKSSDFDSRYRQWNSCKPVQLFDAPIQTFVDSDKKVIAKNIETESRGATVLYIWTDCDREGEHIGTEIRDIALRVNSRLEVKRAKFSNIERDHVVHAAHHPILLDERQANAVAARIELDLRIGAAFTRMQSMNLKPIVEQVQDVKVISYGSCQFPTLGFVVDRYLRVQKFKPEPFWGIRVVHRKNETNVTFNWDRFHLFDRMVVTILFERCLSVRLAKVTNVQKKPTSKWRPLPLTTVELQKMGSWYLHMNSQRIMKVAEDLYTKGWISYPRTETDQFDRGMDLQGIIRKQTTDSSWGPFAQSLLDGNFNFPRSGRNNDKAHPPIHPVNYVVPTQLSEDERAIYNFVVRRFLACCSDDARGELTTLEMKYGSEIFRASGLLVLEKNYLDVYPFEKWESSQQLPPFSIGEEFEPTDAQMTDGKTTKPGYLTEPELIGLMDANGIGTDATMAEHIAKIKERSYVMTRSRSGGARSNNSITTSGGRGSRGSRARGGGRAGRGGSGSRNNDSNTRSGAVDEFIPTTLGVALIEGYDNVGFETNLSKPFLRKEMEMQMKAICAGTRSRNDVVQENLEQYRDVFVRTQQQIHVLKESCRRYILG